MRLRNTLIHGSDDTAIVSEDGDFYITLNGDPILELSESIGSRIFLALDASVNPHEDVADFLEKSNCHGTTNAIIFGEFPLATTPSHGWDIADRVLWSNFADYHFRGRPEDAQFPPIIKYMRASKNSTHRAFPFGRISRNQGHSFIVLGEKDNGEIIFEKKGYSASPPSPGAYSPKNTLKTMDSHVKNKFK